MQGWRWWRAGTGRGRTGAESGDDTGGGAGPAAARPWHSMDTVAVFSSLATSPEGLGRDEASRRLARHGPNRLPEPHRRGPVLRFLAQFHNLLIYVLLVAAAVTALLAHWVDTGVILAVVLINAVIGFIQEGRAEDALKAIDRLLSPRAMVLRAGERCIVDAGELVPGDVVLLQSGDKVPADLRLFRVHALQIQEAMLTGESEAVEKTVEPLPEEAVIGDRRNMAYSGTLVTHGRGSGVVVATGSATEIGRISGMLAQVRTLTTPLLRQMSRFAAWLTGIIVAVSAGTFLFGILVHGSPAADMFMAAVGLAVAAIPEGLPAILTITLAIGVQRMARRHAIIRRLPAVETLGSVSIICSDKTGTLTHNEMTVEQVATAEAGYRVTGEGYDPHGGFLRDGRPVAPEASPVLAELTRAALLCNDATLRRDDDGRWVVEGDPTEGALLVLGMKAGLDPVFEAEMRPRSDVIPFESEHRFMATLHHDHTGHAFAYVKGAPERLLEMCSWQRSDDGQAPLDLVYWERQMEQMARQGQRVLAIASVPFRAGVRELRYRDLSSGLVLLGMVGMMDPPREEAIEAVRRCRSAGIRVKMITGDHAVTALAIGHQMGIGDGRSALTGSRIETMSDMDLRRAVRDTDVFARSSPEHKLRLVQAMQANGAVVAMTGDGVNDAPALKRADVGIAMGGKGTEVAREAAEVVLADDNFASIAEAVVEGRTVYDNLRKAILFILPTNGGEAFTIIAAILLGHMLPVTPVQILWVNMITAVTLALALSFESSERDIMQRPPRDPDEPLLGAFFIWRILFVSVILVAGTFGLFLWELDQGGDIEQARTVAVNTLVLFEIFYLLNSRYLTASVLNREGITGNRYALAAAALLLLFQLLFTYWGPMQLLFHSRELDAATWLRILLVASTVLWLVELEKVVVRRLRHV